MNYENIPEEHEEPVEAKTPMLNKRHVGLVASYDSNIKEFKLHCPANCDEPKFVSILGKDVLRCKGCGSEYNKLFIGAMKEIIQTKKADSAPRLMHTAEGEEFAFYTFQKVNGVMHFNLAFKRCVICKNKKAFCNISTKVKKNDSTKSLYTRCGCGVRTYENLGNAKYFTESFNEGELETLFSHI